MSLYTEKGLLPHVGGQDVSRYMAGAEVMVSVISCYMGEGEGVKNSNFGFT